VHEVITHVIDSGSTWYTFKLFLVSYVVENPCCCSVSRMNVLR